ncbi:MAG: hypothetical protein KGJ43_07845, partial [Acidobacteriota bacterium]|nr:hypothetical protein [Acidobacteriota bacterium]
ATTTTTTAAAIGSTQLARLLGLPRDGTRFTGLRSIAIGHAECPPACSVLARLYTRVTVRRRHRRVQRSVLVGFLFLKLAGAGRRALAVGFNGTGRRMLERAHSLSVQLQLDVTDAEGGSWALARAYTLATPPPPKRRHARVRRLTRR